MLFDPDEYKGKGDVLTFQRYRLDEATLLEYAKRATSLRAIFLEKAAFIARSDGDGDAVMESMTLEKHNELNRGYTPQK